MKVRKRYPAVFAILIVTLFFIYGCNINIDLRGFFYSLSTPDERFEQSRSLPQPADITPEPGGFSLIFISDTHFTEDNIVDINSLVGRITDLAPSAVIGTAVLGDLVQNGQQSGYIDYVDSTSGLTVFNTIGNHDVYSSGWNYYKEYIGPSSYVVRIGEENTEGSLLLINLDSANATLGGKQTQWLVSLLETERDNYTYCVVITHSNFFPAVTGTVVQFSDKAEVYSLVNLFNEYNVNFVLSGHSHQLTSYQLFNTQYLTLDSIKDNQSHFMIMSTETGSLLCETYSKTVLE